MAKAKVEIDVDLCKGCELCVSVCSQGVLAIDKTVLNEKGYSPAASVYPEKCTGCANCAIMCPDSSIRVIKI